MLLFGYMLACPGCVYINRGNHESFDMNIRGFHEGGGFASEVASKYDPDVFALFQQIFNPGKVAAYAGGECDPDDCEEAF